MRLTQSASLVETIHRAVSVAREYPHAEVQPIHLLKALLVPDLGPATRALEIVGSNIHEVRAIVDRALDDLPCAPHSRDAPPSSSALKAVLKQAEIEAQTLEARQIDDAHALLAIVGAEGGLPESVRKSLGLRRKSVLDALSKLAAAAAVGGTIVAGATAAPRTGALEFCDDLTARAERGALDPVLGRGQEIARVVEVLARRRKNNPLVVGEPGTGKTALVEGLAQSIAAGAVPPHLAQARVFSLDLASMVAGAKYKGEFEERFKKLIDELSRRGDAAILFIDEIHTLLGVGKGGGGIDAANMLKPPLARGEIRVLGATTNAEYREHFETDPAFARRFVPVHVGEPDDTTTREILVGLAPSYARHHGVEYTAEAFDAAVKLSRRYIPSRFLPDKAVDLLDEAGADVRILSQLARKVLEEAAESELGKFIAALNSRGLALATAAEGSTERDQARLAADRYSRAVVDAEAIARRVSIASGIPVQKMTASERDRLVRLEDHLHGRVIGQDGPISSIANAIRRSRTGLKQRASQPIGSFLFLGPTGTGKTELAKALAEFLFSDERSMVRIDMTEYRQEHTVQRLIGPPPGYVGYEQGGALTEAVKNKPYSVVLFDEIDKAHPACLDILIPLLDDGRLTDGKSNTIDCSNTVVILTSNYAGPWIARQFREKGGVDRGELMERLLRPAGDQRPGETGFRPELINRFDDYQVFHPLTPEQVRKIVDLQIERLIRTLREQGIELEVTPEARLFIADEGYDPEMGARPVRRVIDRRIGDPLSLALAGEELLEGIHATAVCANKELKVEVGRKSPNT